MFWWTVIGTAAGGAGLFVGIYTLIVAKGARRAAQDASTAARSRNLVEDLGSANQKVQQVGNFIQQEEWLAVRLRAEEILAICRSVLTRWPDQLSDDRKDELATTCKWFVQ
jgi:hypothetical protein